VKKLVILAMGAMIAFYVHARIVFSEAALAHWVGEQTARELSGDGKACDFYDDHAEVEIIAETARGRFEVSGGKQEMCDYLRQSTASLIVLQAQANTTTEDFVVQAAGFPWMTADVSFTNRTSISAPSIPSFSGESTDKMTLQRSLGGLKIVKFESNGKSGAP
jgi:hypothetical protein